MRLKEETELDMVAQLRQANESVDTLRTAEVSCRQHCALCSFCSFSTNHDLPLSDDLTSAFLLSAAAVASKCGKILYALAFHFTPQSST